jgi:WD40 repeat protein
MALEAVKKTGKVPAQVYPQENVQLPNDVVKIVYFKLAELRDIHSLLLTNWQFNQCISHDNLLWGDFVKFRFPYSYQTHENCDNFKGVLRSLTNEDRNIEEHKFRTCSWKGHATKVTCTASQKDKFVSGSEDGTVILWDRHTRKQLFKWDLSAHGACTSLAMDVEALFAGFQDGFISGWNPNSGETIHQLDGAGPIDCLQMNGSELIFAAAHRAVKIWDRTKKTFKQFSNMANSVAVHKNRFLVGGLKFISVLDENGNNDGSWEGHDNFVNGLTVQGDRFFSCTSHCDIMGWHIGPEVDGKPSIKYFGKVQVPEMRRKIVPGIFIISHRNPEEPIDLIAREDKVFYVYDDIAVLDFKNGKILYSLKSKQSTTSACMQDGMLFSGSEDGTLTIRDFNFPSLTAYDGHTLETNFSLLGMIADKDDPLWKQLHSKFADRFLELSKKYSSFNEVSLRLEIEVGLHLLLDRIHRGDQKRISEILTLPIWNKMSLIDSQTKKLYKSIKTICFDQTKQKSKEKALESLKQKEQAVLKFIQHLKK